MLTPEFPKRLQPEGQEVVFWVKFLSCSKPGANADAAHSRAGGPAFYLRYAGKDSVSLMEESTPVEINFVRYYTLVSLRWVWTTSSPSCHKYKSDSCRRPMSSFSKAFSEHLSQDVLNCNLEHF